jgi:predicted O-linked N-acetylglucosamine transferase (SPINDLY family)
MPDVADRVRFLPRMGYDAFLTLTREADVLLDTTQWSGGNTALEAIALNRPMVMLPGQFMRGRISAGLYDCNGFTGSICTSADEYVQTALRLGLDPDHRREADRAVAGGADRLFQQTECLRELERILVDNYLGAS